MATLAVCRIASEGSSLIVDLQTDQDSTIAGPLTLQLARHDNVARDFFASFQCQKASSGWQGRMNLEASSERRLIELVQITDEVGQSAISINSRQLFFEPAIDGPWLDGAVAQAEHDRLTAARIARFDVPIVVDDAAETDPEFTVVMLADNLHLTNPQHVPGISVIPLKNTTLGRDVAQVLNDVLTQLGFGSIIDVPGWLTRMRQLRPAAAIRAARVRANTPDAAVQHCRETIHVLLDLLALRRGHSPRLLGGVTGRPDSAGIMQGLGFWIEGPGYTGNLLGGFISGEDPHYLLTQWEGLTKEPRTKLWLSLYADAIADQRWDYRLFRCFNLLEGIATEFLPKGQKVLDTNGNPRLMSNGSAYTTNQARGKVYELVRVISSRGQLAEASFAAPQADGSPADLWFEVGLWVEIRNAVAHRGSWTLPAGEAPSAKHAKVEAEMISRAHNQTAEYGALEVVRAIRSATEFVLNSAFMDRL